MAYVGAAMRDAAQFLPRLRLRILGTDDAPSSEMAMELPSLVLNRSVRLAHQPGAVPDDDESLMLRTIEAYYREMFPVAMQLEQAAHVEALFRDASRTQLMNFVSAIGRRIWHRKPPLSLLPEILGMFEELSTLTYEGHPASMSVMLANRQHRRHMTVHLGRDLVASKKTARLFSGGHHVIASTLDGEIAGIEVPPAVKGTVGRPPAVHLVAADHQALAGLAHRRRAMSFVLAENGDLSLIAERRTIAMRQHGIWRLVGAVSFVQRLSSLLEEMKKGTATSAAQMAHFITMLALSLNRRREGALLVLVPDGIPSELLPRRLSSTIEATYQSLLAPRSLFAVPVSLLLAALSIDGATFVSAERMILAFGQILVVPHSVEDVAEGARTRAATTASKHGIALKVSADGPITLYAKGVVAGELLPPSRTDLRSMQLQLLF